MIKEVKGDLVEMAKKGEIEALVHGCNCQCNMGSGIAKQVRESFPEAYAADCQTIKGDSDKLGSYSSAKIKLKSGHEVTVINAYTQDKYWPRNVRHADYTAIDNVCAAIAADFEKDVKIGFPLIGAGLAGGDWEVIFEIIKKHLSNHDVTIVHFDKQ